MVVAPPVVAVDVSASPLVVVQRVVVPPRSSGASKKPLPELLLCLTMLASLCLSVADPAMTSFVAFLLPLDRLVESRARLQPQRLTGGRGTLLRSRLKQTGEVCDPV